jgi:hypothetical protein
MGMDAQVLMMTVLLGSEQLRIPMFTTQADGLQTDTQGIMRPEGGYKWSNLLQPKAMFCGTDIFDLNSRH